MGRRALIALAIAASACTDTGGNAIVRLDGGPVCQSGDNSCAAGTRCVNRICTPSCTGDAGCAAGSYCEGPAPLEDVCASNVPIVCQRSLDCPGPQLCLGGLCISEQLRADGGSQGCIPSSLRDACGPDALCFQTRVSNQCLGMPACAANGGCPVGNPGSVCNDGRNPDGGQLFPGKQRICLYGFCVADTDCTQKAHCFHPLAGDPLGNCNFGVAGDPCFSNADCIGSSGCSAPDGGFTDGGAPGVCH